MAMMTQVRCKAKEKPSPLELGAGAARIGRSPYSAASVGTGIFPVLAKKRKKNAASGDSVASEYKKLTGRDSVVLKGIANVMKKDGNFYIEFPTRLMGREFLVTNRLQKVPSELNEAGVNKGVNYENQVVAFEWLREEKKLCVRQQRLTPEVPPTDAVALSVADNYINPLVAVLKVEAVAPDSGTVVVKVDDLFNGKQTGLNDVFNRINLGTSANADLSRVLDIKAFESNITATSELTTVVTENMSKVNVTVVNGRFHAGRCRVRGANLRQDPVGKRPDGSGKHQFRGGGRRHLSVRHSLRYTLA